MKIEERFQNGGSIMKIVTSRRVIRVANFDSRLEEATTVSKGTQRVRNRESGKSHN